MVTLVAESQVIPVGTLLGLAFGWYTLIPQPEGHRSPVRSGLKSAGIAARSQPPALQYN